MATGKSDFDPEKVKVDNKCEFGLWLHYEIDAALQSDRHYEDAVKLHASFHRLAADILREATTGNQSKAAKLLNINRVTVWNRMKKYGIDLKKVLSV